jgi:hypothetical protein
VLTGLLWLRARTSPNAVIAVNNVSNLQYPSYRYFYYSAFSERQIFLEGFDFTPAFSLGATRASVRELKRRLELTDRIFRDGSASAIEAAQRKYGVDYLLVDRRDTLPHHPPPASIARLVFSNADVQIYVIASPGVLATA